MNLVTVRRICQGVCLALFLWFCLVSSLGESFWQLRGWPVNWFLQMDPLAGLLSFLAGGTLYAGMAWGALVLAATALVGRFFCGFICPFGALHQLVGWLGMLGRSVGQRQAAHRPGSWQDLKYYLLAFLLAAALADFWGGWGRPAAFLAGLAALAMVLLAARRGRRASWLAGAAGGLGVAWALWVWLLPAEMAGASLLAGLLDPIPLMQRSVNLALLPLADAPLRLAWPVQRWHQGAGLIGLVFVALVLANLWRPRFFCRYLCPAGALMGLVGRLAPARVRRDPGACNACGLCERACTGGCAPHGDLKAADCVLCLNCLEHCPQGALRLGTTPALAPSAPPDLGRRGVVGSLAAGAVAVPILRAGGLLGPGWDPSRIRPPGALAEGDFLRRCLRCGQCMRVCPTGVIQPAGPAHGLEAMWTPVLNMRLGTSGCQLNCTACGQICPTAAIRPLSLARKLGRGEFADQGPVRLGTAFVDRGRCLPWAMDRPCIVCQENCPVSPKAIVTQEIYQPLAGPWALEAPEAGTYVLTAGGARPGSLATGDYFVQGASGRARITENDAVHLRVAADAPVGEGPRLVVRLQRPQVDPSRCIGCGVCEHECPVAGKRAIRVSAENESRHRRHSLLAGG